MPRLPSLDQVAAALRGVALRFPGTVLAAVFAVTTAQVLVGQTGADEPAELVRLVLAALLAYPLGIAVTVTAERVAPAASRVAGLLATAAATAGFALAADGWTSEMMVLRFLHLAVLFHLLAACAPFLGRREPDGFWQYNRRLLERLVLATLYSAVLFIGLALALAALDNLFGVDVPEKLYLRLWLTMALGFHPLFVLAGVPADLAALDRDHTWPAVLRAFARFALVPLATLYLVILTAYFVKVVATGQWPSGWIGWLVGGAATLGILTLLLSSPPATHDEAPWAALFARWFWPALVPAAAMAAVAVGQRIAQYGVTPPRYYLAVLAGWLGVTALGYTVRRGRDLLAIPATLALVAALAFSGPWSAYALSARSQFGRFETLLAAAGALRAGQVGAVAAGTDGRAVDAVAGQARYLVRTFGARRTADWLGMRGLAVADAGVAAGREEAGAVLDALGIAGVAPREGGRFVVRRAVPGATAVSGWDWLVAVRPRMGRDTAWAAGDALAAGIGDDRQSVEVRRGGRLVAAISLAAALDSLASWQAVHGPQEAPARLMELAAPDSVAVLRLRTLGARDTAGTWQVTTVDGEVLVRDPR